ncbi:MAG: ACT domain-containing protein [Christensenellales bacterium]|uniref:ACT domain-containing protein n=1 Tax=Candidatus Avichristensenella intestinipullorum TaxID=2840693 RepID=A0A9D0YX24_9FIRM|nr:ACT domain-containing protein [Christensenellales bacterium]HIQ62986.1 ACT domain-containing protein [Candidatus Avichristensenella intestinipullorum]
MYVQQISVFIENQPGKLAEFAELLGREGIDLVALSIADTTNFGILRCIVCDYERAAKIIGEAGYTARVTDVLAVSVPDKPGGMAQAVRALTDAGISIEYLYSFVRSAGNNALLIFRVDKLDEAYRVLQASGVKLITQEQVRTL